MTYRTSSPVEERRTIQSWRSNGGSSLVKMGHISIVRHRGSIHSETYLKRRGKSQPANRKNLAFGESSPGRPLKRTSCSLSSLPKTQARQKRRHLVGRGNAPVDLGFPLLHLVPSLLVQKVVDLHHGLDLGFRSFPPLADQRVVELLRRRILPGSCDIAGDRRRGALGGEIDCL